MPSCETCGGAGTLTILVPCRTCHGTGEIIIYEDDGTENLAACILCEDGIIYTEVICDTCKGTGVV